MYSINTLNHTTVNMKSRGLACKVSAFSVFLFFALVLSGCSKSEGGGSGKADSFDGKITAKVVNGEDYDSDISKIWALFDASIDKSGELRGRMVAQGEYEDGGFTIELPDVPASYLKNLESFFANDLEIGDELDLSDSDIRILNVDLYGISSKDKYVDYFVYTNNASKPVVCLFVYADGKVTVKGGKNINVTLAEGWNRIYWTPSDNKVSSSAPKGMKWYVNGDL